ncbi:MAG TPA: hypothetical protein VNE41_11695 [Chitinophagaceae bacterium]|nr:hypothetical protein [Chitinophagaceae bacterium]
MFKIPVLFTLICLTFSLTSVAQLDNRILGFDQPVHSKDSGKLMFSFNDLNFMRNTEYFTPIERGETLFGYEVNPNLVFYPTKKFRITGGLIFRKDFGNNNFTFVLPFYSLKYSSNGLSGIFGNLEGGVQHRLIEPMYNIDYTITRPLESGAQFKINHSRLWSDTWINWEHMIYDNSPYKEEIANGSSNYMKVIESPNDSFYVTIPIQFSMHHLGGQISSVGADTLPLNSMYSAATGLIIDKKFNSSSIDEIRTEDYYTWTRTFTGGNYVNFPSGKGYYFNLLFKTPIHFSFMISYWYGEKYYFPEGTDIYQSISDFNPKFLSPIRKLLFLRFFYQRQIYKDLWINLRMEPYHSFDLHTTEYSYSVYISYKRDFTLMKPGS